MTGRREAQRRMTAAEFLEWCTFQEDRYELVDGVPVAMAGAKQVHDRLTVNAIIALGRVARRSVPARYRRHRDPCSEWQSPPA
jgi:Uma2 family endonuclease